MFPYVNYLVTTISTSTFAIPRTRFSKRSACGYLVPTHCIRPPARGRNKKPHVKGRTYWDLTSLEQKKGRRDEMVGGMLHMSFFFF